MKFLLLLLLIMFQDSVDSLINDLDNADPTIRETATIKLAAQEKYLDTYKSRFENVVNPEVKWRLKRAITIIEANQKFRSMSTTSPNITIKFEGTATDLFAKLSEITKQTLDTRAFGDYKVKIDCTDTPLFKVLDEACKQIGFDWEVNYRNEKGDVIDQNQWSPAINYTTSIELTGAGMSDKTPNHTAPGFKMQVAQTSFSVNNAFNGPPTVQAGVMFKFAADPSMKFVVGPRITYTKMVTNAGVETINTSELARYALCVIPPDSKSISLKGKAKYRFPMKTETINLDLQPLNGQRPDAQGNRYLGFAEYTNIKVIITSNNQVEVHMEGADNLAKDRFLGVYSVKKPDGTVILENNGGNSSGSGYMNVYADYLSFFIYGAGGSNNELGSLSFEYVTELRDMEFDFSIDNIPLY